MMTARKRIRPLPMQQLSVRHSVDYSSSDSSSRHLSSDHSSPDLPSTSAGPSRKRRRSLMTSVPALPLVSGALSPVRAGLIPSPKRVRDISYLADVDVSPRETRVERVMHPAMPKDIPEPAQEGVAEFMYETLGDLVQRFHAHTQAIPVHRVQVIKGVQRETKNNKKVRMEETEEMEMEIMKEIRKEETEDMEMKGIKEMGIMDELWRFHANGSRNSDLTWWNFHKRKFGVDAAYAMKWAGLMKLITKVYCLRNEVQKMETELWNLTVKGNDLTSYTQRFQELILLRTRMVPNEDDRLMDKKLQGYAAKSAENKRRMDSNPRDNHGQQPSFKRQNTTGHNVARAYTAGNNERKGFVGSFPYYNKCRLHHEGLCTISCENCKKIRILFEKPTEVDGDGNEFVVFDDAINNKGCKRWDLTLCGHFVGHQMSINELRYNLQRMWGRKGFKDVVDVTNGVFFMKLFSEDGMESVVNSRPWMVYDTGCGTHICITKKDFRGSRKLKQGDLYLYVGNGVRAQVEVIGSFDLVLPNGLCFMDFRISVSRNNVPYFNAIPSNGIYEIDLSNRVPNVNSINNVSNKRVKHNLDSTYLWHCHLAHISKKRIEKLQQDGLLKSTDDESFYQCVSCLSGKMTRKSFPHCPEKATDVFGLIDTDSYEALVKREMPDKLQKGYVKCIFIGYPKETMGYYFHFPPENKIIIASEVPMEVEGFEPPREEEALIRRSERPPQSPDGLCLNVEAEKHSLGDLNEPANYKAAIKWLFKKKTDMDGNVHTYKARLVANEFTQTYGVDYEETFLPVADIRAIRILIAITTFYVYEIWKMDNSGKLHWTAMKTILKYLRNTKDMFLVYGGNPEAELRVECYCDVGFETDRDDIKSRTRYVVLILNGGVTAMKTILKYLRNTKDMFLVYGGNPEAELRVECYLEWKSSNLSTTAMSATEAEYIAASEAGMEAVLD
nr:hypothetical protein [Tanacetum cinerariifolium]